MPSRVAGVEPVADRAAAATARSWLAAVDYDEQHIVDLLGDDGPGADAEDVPVLERRLPSTPLAAAVRLLLLQLPLPERDAIEALGDDGLGALVTLGLLARRARMQVGRSTSAPATAPRHSSPPATANTSSRPT